MRNLADLSHKLPVNHLRYGWMLPLLQRGHLWAKKELQALWCNNHTTIASVLSIRVHVRRLHKLFDSLLLIPSMHIQHPCMKLLLVLGQTSSPFGEPFPCRIFDSDSFALVLECKNGSSDTHRHTSTPFLCCCRHKVHICPACEAPALQSPAKASFPPKVH